MASTDTIEDNTEFASMHEASFPILADTDKSVSAAFGVLSPRGYANRWTFYIDKAGIIRAIDRQVNPMTAGEQLVRTMGLLGFPEASPADE
jgi:peroxiredoxin